MVVTERKVTVKVDGTRITLSCPQCHVETEVRGLVWENILHHLGMDDDGKELLLDAEDREYDPFTTPIIRVCSSCRYRKVYNSRPLTTEQKQKRSEYNKKRRDQINEALELMRELKGKGGEIKG